MTKHLPLLLFLGLAWWQNDLFAQNKSKFNKPRMTGKEKAEAKKGKDQHSEFWIRHAARKIQMDPSKQFDYINKKFK